MTYPRALTELFLQDEPRAKGRSISPLAGEPRLAKRIALKARRRQTRDLGTI
ncbi:MAG: hypothetical protein HOV76_19820 [Hamadaea sp.]|nr:hypothetical protein [Hamadaea sp.]